MKHAILSPSGAKKWLNCTGSIAMESEEPNTSSEYADEGTAAHELAAHCLTTNKDAKEMIGSEIVVGERTFVVDDTMAGHVQVYLNNIRDYAKGNEMMVEQKLPIDHITGEAGATGTGDVVVIADEGDEIQIHDLKYGQGVAVSAVENEQLMIYALGALDMVSLMGILPKRFRLVIHQVRLTTAPSEWVIDLPDLLAFGNHVREKAHRAMAVLKDVPPGERFVYLNAGDHCKDAFCRARANCPKLASVVQESMGVDFEELPAKAPEIPQEPATLADKMALCDLIEDWCKQVRAKVEYEMLQGRVVPGFKLVQGRQGNRAWTSKEEVETIFKSMRLKIEEMYDLSLISPTTAEKVLKETPKRWKRVSALITRSEGKPSVAPASDKRPALVMKPPIDDFQVEGEDLV